MPPARTSPRKSRTSSGPTQPRPSLQSRRSGVAAASRRRSFFGDQTNTRTAQHPAILPETAQVESQRADMKEQNRKQGRGSLAAKGRESAVAGAEDQVTADRRDSLGLKEDRQVSAAAKEAKRLIAAFDPSSSTAQSPSSAQAYRVHNLLRAFASRQTSKATRKSDEGGGHNAAWNPLEIEWSIFKDWPEGLEREEKEMKQYYKYLKFIHLEHETKIRFINEIMDDLEADPPREAVVYTARDVKEKEAEMFAVKAQLKEAKQVVRSLRADIDVLADKVAVPYKQLNADCAEAKALLDECTDLELELVKMKSEGGAAGAVTELDVEEMELEVLPPVGTLTEREAERFCERQEEALVQLEDENANLDTLMARLRTDAKQAIKAVDRLASERHVAERQAREAREMGIGGRKRDKEVERACANHSATLTLLRSLFGLRRIEALDDNRVNLVWLSGDGCELGLVLAFDQPGGKLESIELQHPSQPPLCLPPAGMDLATAAPASLSPEFGPLLRAIKANDVPVVVMEAWDWVERNGMV